MSLFHTCHCCGGLTATTINALGHYVCGACFLDYSLKNGIQKPKFKPVRLYGESGQCTRCGEWTELGRSCCGAPVEFEGSTYTDEAVLERDMDLGLCCDCEDCKEAEDGPCEFDCEVCQGCKEAKSVRLDAEFDIDRSQGRK